MAKTTRLTGHAAFASPFSPAFPVHQSIFIRAFLGRLFAQTKKRFFHSEQIAHSPKAELLIRITRPAETCRDFSQGRFSAR